MLWLRSTLIGPGIGRNGGWGGQEGSSSMESDIPLLTLFWRSRLEEKEEVSRNIRNKEKSQSMSVARHVSFENLPHSSLNWFPKFRAQLSSLAPKTNAVISSCPLYRLRNDSIRWREISDAESQLQSLTQHRKTLFDQLYSTAPYRKIHETISLQLLRTGWTMGLGRFYSH